MSATGHIDALTSSGFLEGWAFDPDRIGRALEIAILFRRREVARGLANRFRWDLADRAWGIGWCAFRLRIDGMISTLRRGPLVLIDVQTSTPLARLRSLPIIEDLEPNLSTVADVAQADPTVITTVDQLRGCTDLFDQYIALNSPASFVRAAYLYVLGRPADAGGLDNYLRLLTARELTPYGVLHALHDSDEFRSATRLLSSPLEPGFIFALA